MAGRRMLSPWEARLLREARYTAPSDTRLPRGWTLSAGGIPVPPVPDGQDLAGEIQATIAAMEDPDLAGEIQAAIAAMQDPDLAEDQGNLVF